MNHYPPSVLKLIKHLARLPGVGEKTAERLAMHILRAPRTEAEQLSRSIIEIKEKVRRCSLCFSLSDTDICQICSDPARTSSMLCVVEQPADMVAIEKSESFKGLYHILGGALSPMDGIGPDDIRIKELVARIAQGKTEEVILATSTTIEGETTADYIANHLGNQPVRITRIASGVPVGGDLKYVDQVTLRKSMETRHAIK
ncbi:MAG: recombination mediator RecR [Desulfobacterales bacterium]|jgi:recombination protein RecR|nr:recombination mediator RecR [Desulfobacterales bacterium]